MPAHDYATSEQNLQESIHDPEPNLLKTLALEALEMIMQAQAAAERLADERTRQKLSPHRATAVAKELGQLRIVLGDYKYKHAADIL